ncbi:FAD:protein FMN transferase [Streptomyces sp. TLI_171]|uniref:FAD:protein FMN transferase n=1 Tax=Streptomyces sp. TLI_171 TaxID=1938859 RepID=UPI000C386018|nr:FAD:protein FMN transferase [Streptomyces sp. TLI_171]RKE21620.1 thiamine biosynthesis lipoprotein [Streptomyces sp. TLI_171]
MTSHVEHVMGTVFSFSVRDPGPRTAGALSRIVDRLHRIDAVFSPYRPDSEISRLDRGELRPADCDPEVRWVLERCAELAAETDGYFSDRPGGRLDPSGFVKGWAVQEASRALRAAGSADHCVSGGGDVQTAGGPWRVGIADPHREGAVARVVAGHDLAVATSGTAERGPHILDPHTGRPATGFASLTLLGPGLARLDALATAAFAMGPSRATAWLAARGVPALAVLPDGTQTETPGFAGYAGRG